MARRELYNIERSHLLKAMLSTYEQYDKSILAMSAAALGFSITFIKEIVPAEHLVMLNLIICSWMFFAVAILSTIASFLLSRRAIDTQLRFSEQYYLQKNDEYANKRNPYGKATEVCNVLSGASFFVGIILTVIFASTCVVR